MIDWSGVVDVEYGTIVLEVPGSPPPDIDYDRYHEDRCVATSGGVHISLPDKNPRVPTRVRVLAEPAPIEPDWEHVAEVGLDVPSGRLLVYSWMPDEDLAATIDVPAGSQVARIHWTGLGEWFRLVMANRHLEASAVLRLRIDLVRGTLLEVRTLRSWEGWVAPIEESRGTNGLRRYRGTAAESHRDALQPTGRRFWPPYPTTEEGNVTALLRDRSTGSSWAAGFDRGHQFLQELTPDEADQLLRESFPEVRTYARDAEGRIWSADLAPLERAAALEYVPPSGWDRVQRVLRPDEYRLVELPDGWARISRWQVASSLTRELVGTVLEEDEAVIYQRWPDGTEIPW